MVVNRSEPREGNANVWRAVLGWIGIGILAAVAALVVFSSQQAAGTAIFAVGIVVSLAAMLSGGLIGFVFGVPRQLTTENAERRADSFGVAANTNLEQISDWLTKILVGVGLTQFHSIGKSAVDLFGALAPSFGGGVAGKAFAGGLVTFSAVFGLVTGWLYTRLVLGTAMVRADRRAAAAAVLNHMADEMERAGDPLGAEGAREQARDVLRGLSPISAAYDRARRLMPAGPPRTAEFDRLADEARSVVKLGRYDPVAVIEALSSGSSGERIAALTIMEIHPDASYLDSVCTVALEARSRDEQYRALLVARALVPYLGDPEKERLRALLKELRKSLSSTTARAKLAAEIAALVKVGDS
ncbi:MULTISPECIES: hypothetical protein [unclassified Actinoplanes]|uniref:hypothetical protein n=1 Tax=unclassified Actinoplanes TaxID=2626549 RepID=UPI0012BAC114|nr:MULTISPECIES: hypothetical protein [unclassified Actinoplanes]